MSLTQRSGLLHQQAASMKSQRATSLSVVNDGALEEAVSVDVIDTGSGTATPGADYRGFAPIIVTFPAGAVSEQSKQLSWKSSMTSFLKSTIPSNCN